MADLDFRILGSLEALRDGQQLALGGAKQRALLAILLINANRVVSTDSLIEALWPNKPPGKPLTAIQGYVSALRRVLAPDQAFDVIVTEPAGYRISVERDALDLTRFQALAGTGRDALASQEPLEASTALTAALSLFRGAPLADFAFDDWARVEIDRIEELQVVCVEDRIDADLDMGRHAELVGELEALIAGHPMRERFRAQLMLALYQSGRQAEALDVYQATRTALIEELGLEPGPEIQALHGQILNQDPALAAPARQAPREHVVRLPTPTSTFIGRERELAEVSELLENSATKLLTLAGPGGTGKTRLAIESARLVSDHFPDGVFWVSLASLRDPSLFVPTVAQTLEVTEEPGRSLADTLADNLADKEALLLLDNVEQLLPDAAAKLAYLALTPGPTLLVTSRERLQLQGEQLYPVPTLAEPDAMELFVARARALEPTFKAGGAVTELCSRLDNLPLALELAAARTVIFSPEQLLERLSQRLDLLKAGRDADPRQQTLRATIEWSYELLNKDEQRLFRSLSVFAGGCTYEAAEAVGGAEPDTLQSLVEKSLLRRRDSDAESRYWSLETIREYAAAQLQAEGETPALQERHRDFFLAFAEQTEPQLWGGQDEAFVRVESEDQNLRAALATAIGRHDADGALSLATSIYRFWENRSRYSEARSSLSQALALVGGRPNLRAKALMGIGRAARFQCEWSEAIAALEQSAEAFRDLEDPAGVSRCLGFLGHAYLFTGDVSRAADVLEENLSVARQTGDPLSIANALYNAAFVYLEQSDFARARDVFEEAGRAHASLRNAHGLTLVTIQLGHVATLAGDYERAGIELESALEGVERMGSPMWSFIVHRYRAQLALLEGRPDDAERLLVSLFSTQGDEMPHDIVATCLGDLAAVAAAHGDQNRAARLWGAVDAALEALGLALEADDRQLRDRFIPRTEDGPDQSSWQAAWAEGHDMSLADALALALGAAPAVAAPLVDSTSDTRDRISLGQRAD